jgi:putative FmdB family regulatory protein
MPTYAYRCEECGRRFDVQASFAEKQAGLEPACPSCEGMRVKQVITAGLLIRSGPRSGISSGCAPNAGSGCCPW